MTVDLPLGRKFCSIPLLLLSIFTSSAGLFAGVECSDPLARSQIIGTQAIGGPYQFTDEPYLLEVAREIENLGSNLIKFNLRARSYMERPYYLKKVSGIRSMSDLLKKHPVFREVMDMDFIFYHIWANPYVKVRWQDGLDEKEASKLYDEFYELGVYLLTEYKGSGKSFYLGHWEGDWLLKGKTDPAIDPTEERILGFAQYLNIRQRAISDARKAYPDNEVWVYHYAEVNQVWKGIDGSRPTLTNSVLPLVDVDYVSYSSYDVIQREDFKEALHLALDHIESQLKPRDDIAGKRVFVGEYAIKASSVGYDAEEHARRNREVTRAIIEWGCPFALYWQYYCNESRGDGYEGFWLVNDKGQKQALHTTFKDYFVNLEQFRNETRKSRNRYPTFEETRDFAQTFFE